MNLMMKSALMIATVLTFSVSTAMAEDVSDAAREQAAENFLEADVNADGLLTFDEFKTLIDLNASDDIGRAGLVKRFNRYSMAFGRIDANGDDLVSPDEMRAAANR